MELKAHLSIPESPIGCLVVVHENRGLDDHIRDVANRFARLPLPDRWIGSRRGHKYCEYQGRVARASD